jgi:hypothetical protein
MRALLLSLLIALGGSAAAQDSASPEPCYEEDCYARSETSWPVVALWGAAALWLIVWLRKK